MKTVIEMAREAGGALSCIAEPLEHPWKFSQAELERFAALVREDEREKIAVAHKIRPRGKSVYHEFLAELEKQQEPVAKVIRNEAGQIAMQKLDGSYFDISKHIGHAFYTTPPTAAWDSVLDKPYMCHHKMTDKEVAFADGWNALRKRLLEIKPTDWMQRALEAEALNERLCAEFNAENGPTFMGEPVIRATPPTAPNLNCKSVQRRLATSWGYVRKEEYDMAKVAAVRQMRDALVHISEYWNRDENETAMADALWHIIETADNAIAALPIPGEEK